jgi:hypothetical protein
LALVSFVVVLVSLAASVSAAQATPGTGLSGELEQTTGLSPAQVSTESVCAPAPAGHATCEAAALVLRSDHAIVDPRHSRRATFTQVFPKGRRGIATQAAASPSAGAPTPGTPAFLQQAYDLTYLSQLDGGGDTVAIVDAYDDPTAEADLATFRSNYGLPACTTGCFEKVNEEGNASPLPEAANTAGGGWEQEESLDLDAVSSVCPNCHIILIEANSSSYSDLDTAISKAQSMGATQISNSWTGPSSSPVSTGSFPGATVLAATGDNGYPGAGIDDYPAAFPGFTAVGGTSLTPASAGTDPRGYSESAWSSSGSGCDLNEAKPTWQTDTGCTGRSWADVSADANPDTGLMIYDSGNGGWALYGGTSLATPLVAAYEAITGVDGATPQWAYADSGLLNDITTGSTGTCAQAILYICNAGPGYDGPTGNGSISGDLVAGAPGIGGPAVGNGSGNTYTQAVTATGATLTGGVYPNGLDTTYYWQYGTSTSYGEQTAATDIGNGTAPVAVTSTLADLAPATTYHYRLVAENSDGTSYGYDFTLTTATPAAEGPTSTSLPALTGTDMQGQTLSASAGTWSWYPVGSYSYHWQTSTDGGSSWSSISDATSATYLLTQSDVGNEVRVAVTATNASGNATADSGASSTILSGAPSNTAAPAISGTDTQGQTLSAGTGAWTPAGTYTYQWQTSTDGGSSWSNISGASSSTYVLGSADIGNTVRIIVTATNTYGAATADSAPSGTILAEPAPSVTTATSPAVSPTGSTDPAGPSAVESAAPREVTAPAVTGVLRQGDTLSASAGTWSWLPAGTYAYQWQRSSSGAGSWSNITGANAATHLLTAADVGHLIRVVVTATNGSGHATAESASARAVLSGAPQAVSSPSITGAARLGQTLRVLDRWQPGATITYRWRHSTHGGRTWSAVRGATTRAFKLGAADVGEMIDVQVTATNAYGRVSVTTRAVGPVSSKRRR